MLTGEVMRSLQSAVGPAEKIYWATNPEKSKLVLKKVPLLFVSLFWNAFTLFWIWGASGFEFKIGGFGMVGIPFLLFGIYLFFAPLIEYFTANYKAYAITERFVYDFRDYRKKKFRTYPLCELEEVSILKEKGRWGDLALKFLPARQDPRDMMQKAVARMSAKESALIDMAKLEQSFARYQAQPYQVTLFGITDVRQAKIVIENMARQARE